MGFEISIFVDDLNSIVAPVSELCARDYRIRIRQPKCNMQQKIVRSLSNGIEFVAYVDAIGHLDGTQRLLEWKTTSARYPDQPEGLTSLDLQLVCYSWITGISDVAIVAFVRKRVPEIQYLLASITEEQRQEFGQLVETTARQTETAQFPSHPGTGNDLCGFSGGSEYGNRKRRSSLTFIDSDFPRSSKAADKAAP